MQSLKNLDTKKLPMFHVHMDPHSSYKKHLKIHLTLNLFEVTLMSHFFSKINPPCTLLLETCFSKTMKHF